MLKQISKKVVVQATTLCAIATLMLPIVSAEASITATTPSQALQNYKKYMASYTREDVPVVESFRSQYDGSLGDKVVARAIWYMEYGSMVYNHKKYAQTGQIDCSNFTQLVYGDFGYNITSASRKYTSVGTRLSGIYAKNDPGKDRYTIVGLSKMQPGDIVAFWDAGRTHIGHVAIYMGIIDGQPRVIGTSDRHPTAIGIDDLENSWMGGRIHSVRRLLPSNAWSPSAGSNYTVKKPTIPAQYFLKPQTNVIMPTNLTYGF